MSSPTAPVTLAQAADRATSLLMSERNDCGWWTGELSTSALSTATAVMALNLARRAGIESLEELITGGLAWLAEHQNEDGGWGDTILSHSNISTTMLVHAVLRSAAEEHQYAEAIRTSGHYIEDAGGVDAVIERYGSDRTFSVPILTHCALAGIVDWESVIPLPFELACIPPRLYNAVRMPVVSYALPALIAIGQVIFHHRRHRNPVVRAIRRRAIEPSLRILDRIQPPNGGFLEATPLTSFVCMSLLGCGLHSLPVTRRCLDFIISSVRDDGSWPIDTNLTTWVTTLSVNALSPQSPSESAPLLLSDEDRESIRRWLIGQQYQTIHPFTNAAPGGWGWTDLPGGVPDADDTPGAMLALLNLRPSDQAFSDEERDALRAAAVWLLDLQNRDGGWPTFCRGWGTLPFDRSTSDLTAHVLRALHEWVRREDEISQDLHGRTQRAVRSGLSFLARQQREDGTWLPLWFGNQWNDNEENPLYGTAKVVLALQTTGQGDSLMAHRGLRWLLDNQNEDGSWSAKKGLPGSVEETSLAVEAICEFPDTVQAVTNGTNWLSGRIQDGRLQEPAPIGFYFAKLWYFERLYPIIFATAALRRACQAEPANDS